MERFLLDTHYWLWLQRGDLGESGDKRLKEIEGWMDAGAVYVSAVSVWEIALLVAQKYVTIGSPVENWVDAGTQPGRFKLVPLDTRTLIEATRLPGEIHGDPADRLLVAAAREHGMTIITRDKKLLAYGKSGWVKARRL